ncbi:MAG TPA: DUF924 family protein [Aquella sp.]|nr:DUF924 family protein [Aquella sp.]
MSFSNYQEVIDFWFNEINPKQWWEKSPQFDDSIRQRFGNLHKAAINGELWAWRSNPLGALAEIILIDQFSRNMYRDTPLAFAYDSMALVLAQTAHKNKLDQELTPTMRAFLYLPFMHSESVLIHQEAVKLFQQAGMEDNLDFELKHKAIIDRFGRYPHRNSILGRESTLKEITFLQTENSSF